MNSLYRPYIYCLQSCSKICCQFWLKTARFCWSKCFTLKVVGIKQLHVPEFKILKLKSYIEGIYWGSMFLYCHWTRTRIKLTFRRMMTKSWTYLANTWETVWGAAMSSWAWHWENKLRGGPATEPKTNGGYERVTCPRTGTCNCKETHLRCPLQKLGNRHDLAAGFE